MTTNDSLAATAINLRDQPIHYLQQRAFIKSRNIAHQTQLKLVYSDIDFNQTAHIRLQQTFAGFPIWNAFAVMHVPHAKAFHYDALQSYISKDVTINGNYYQGIENDLKSTPLSSVLSQDQKTKAMNIAKLTYQQQKHSHDFTFQQNKLEIIIFVNDQGKARFSYLVSFFVADDKTGPHRPTMIIDAMDLHVYRHWDQISHLDSVLAGGIGGNDKIGKIFYDGKPDHLPALAMERSGDHCFLKNHDIAVVNGDHQYQFRQESINVMCLQHPEYSNLFWISLDDHYTRWKADEINGGNSPALDAFYNMMVVKNLFSDWYGIPVITEKDHKTSAKVTLQVHHGNNLEDANWDSGDKIAYFGDGGDNMYPLTTLDVVAHELGHGFFLDRYQTFPYTVASAALYESFADMTAKAAEYYVNGKNDWKIGQYVMKHDDALRYMDDPKKDGKSIDHTRDIRIIARNTTDEYLNQHYSCGIFNKAFYLIATSQGWDTHKAFNIMVKASRDYWTATEMDFTEIACGVLSAAKDYQYNVNDVKSAFDSVGISTEKC